MHYRHFCFHEFRTIPVLLLLIYFSGKQGIFYSLAIITNEERKKMKEKYLSLIKKNYNSTIQSMKEFYDYYLHQPHHSFVIDLTPGKQPVATDENGKVYEYYGEYLDSYGVDKVTSDNLIVQNVLRDLEILNTIRDMLPVYIESGTDEEREVYKMCQEADEVLESDLNYIFYNYPGDFIVVEK